MSRAAKIRATQARRLKRTRAKLSGTATTPRLLVVISSRHVSAQLVDDQKAQTLATSTSTSQKLAPNLKERAEWVGQDIASKAKAAKIKKVVFDRGRRLYHGRVKALAQAARKNGLEF